MLLGNLMVRSDILLLQMPIQILQILLIHFHQLYLGKWPEHMFPISRGYNIVLFVYVIIELASPSHIPALNDLFSLHIDKSVYISCMIVYISNKNSLCPSISQLSFHLDPLSLTFAISPKVQRK